MAGHEDLEQHTASHQQRQMQPTQRTNWRQLQRASFPQYNPRHPRQRTIWRQPPHFGAAPSHTILANNAHYTWHLPTVHAYPPDTGPAQVLAAVQYPNTTQSRYRLGAALLIYAAGNADISALIQTVPIRAMLYNSSVQKPAVATVLCIFRQGACTVAISARVLSISRRAHCTSIPQCTAPPSARALYPSRRLWRHEAL